MEDTVESKKKFRLRGTSVTKCYYASFQHTHICTYYVHTYVAILRNYRTVATVRTYLLYIRTVATCSVAIYTYVCPSYICKYS